MRNKIIVVAIFLFFVALPVLAAQKQDLYSISIKFDKGKVSFGDNISKSFGYLPLEESEDMMSQYRYYLELISQEGKILEKKKFSIHNEISTEPPIEGKDWEETGIIKQEQMEHVEFLSYHDDGALLRLYSINKRMVDQKDISFLQVKQNKEVVEKAVPLEKVEKQSACDDSGGKCNSNFWLDNAIYIFLLLGATILWLLFLKRQRSKF